MINAQEDVNVKELKSKKNEVPEKQKYNLNNLDDNYQIINQIGLRRGLLNKGIVDVSKVETLLLNEFKKGIICRFTLERP